VTLLPFAFLIARKMYDRLCEGLRPLYYYAYVFFSLFSLTVVTLLWGLHLADVQTGTTSLSNNPHISQIGFIVTYHLVISVVLLASYFSGLRWRWKLLVLAALEVFYYVIYRIGLLIIKPGWFLPVSAVVLIWTYASIALMDRLYGIGGIPALKLQKYKK
jgi:hypothetical protein